MSRQHEFPPSVVLSFRGVGVAGLAAAAGLMAPAVAAAAYAPGAVPASARGSELADAGSRAPVAAADGRYVVFQTASSVLLGAPGDPDERYVGGLVRKDLVTGDVALVAPPQRVRRDDGSTVGTGTASGAAGISADGRYVLFATGARLASGDGSGLSPDVYVRDMDAPLAGTTAYELVSARDGAATGAEYADPAVGSAAGLQGYALSADGRRAVFVTLGASDLPARDQPDAPRWQVWVRDLDARSTRLVSRDVSDGSEAGTPAAPPERDGVPPVVAISADGATVTWTAGEAQRQTRTLPGEGSLGGEPTLLWRRLADGPVPGRRVAGVADLDDPACDPHTPLPAGDTATGPCLGPFVISEGRNQGSNGSSLDLGGISADGTRVLFASSAGRRPYVPAAHRPGTAYLADMRPGVPRKTGVRVAWSYPESLPGRHPVLGGRLAPDGRHAVFSSRDNRFDGLQGVGTFPNGDLLTSNVYASDLDAGTVELVTRAVDGGDYSTGLSDRPVQPPLAVSRDAGTVAFTAADGNLFVGDANGVPDVLVARTAAVGAGHDGRVLPLPPVGSTGPDLGGSAPVAAPLRSRFLATYGPVRVSRRTGTATLRVSLPA
ncbi:hypothetical protein ACVU7I_07705, partial [Patulibacter sp. S7RM1-6]